MPWKKGVKFSLFLDEASSDVLSTDVAGCGLAAAGLPGGTLVGGTSKLTLRLDENASASVKIRSEVLVSGLGVVVFKANLPPRYSERRSTRFDAPRGLLPRGAFCLEAGAK